MKVQFQTSQTQSLRGKLVCLSVNGQILLSCDRHFYHLLSILSSIYPPNSFGGLGVVCWPLVPKFAGSNPAEAVGFLG